MVSQGTPTNLSIFQHFDALDPHSSMPLYLINKLVLSGNLGNELATFKFTGGDLQITYGRNANFTDLKYRAIVPRASVSSVYKHSANIGVAGHNLTEN